MTKVRILFFIPYFESGGAEGFIMNVLPGLLERGFLPVILCIKSKPSIYDAKLSKLGVPKKDLVSSRGKSSVWLYFRAYVVFFQFLRKSAGNFQVMHFNIAQGEELPFVWMAKVFHIPMRIAHSHNAHANSRIKIFAHYLCRFLFGNSANYYLACSAAAAKWLLPAKFYREGQYELVNNGIDTRAFCFDSQVREEYRRHFKLQTKKVLINVGRLSAQKNQRLLLETFAELTRSDSEFALIIVGEGELRAQLHDQADRLNIADKILWLSNRHDIPALLSASDVFVMTSNFEGLPFSLVEAQCSGLPSIVSDKVSKESEITDLVTFCSLNVPSFLSAIRHSTIRNDERKVYPDVLKQNGYDTFHTVSALANIYRKAER